MQIDAMRTGLLIMLGCALWQSGCADSQAKTAKSEAPAKVEKPPDEAAIATVTLTEAANRRLGITTGQIERKPVPRRRTFGGIVEVPLGGTLIVSAPLAGTLEKASGNPMPAPGSRLNAGQSVFLLKPLLSPERYVPTPAEQAQIANVFATLATAKALAQGDIDKAQAEVDAAGIALARAERLLEDRAGSRRAVDEAQATLSIAQASLEAARERRLKLEQFEVSAEQPGQVEPIPIIAPQQGILRSVSVAPGEIVPAGAQLFEVITLDRLWIRVPVYVGLADQIELQAEAEVRSLDGRPRGRGSDLPDAIRARPVAAPPSADPMTSSVDLIYVIENAGQAFRPGERVGVTVSLLGEAEHLTVPWRAVLHDIYGGTWVYEQIGEREYRRSRVQVQYVVEETAALATGPEPGTVIVLDGAAELFGTEFGTGK